MPGRTKHCVQHAGAAVPPSRVFACSPTAVQNALKECASKGWVRFQEDGQEKRYRLTEKGEKRAAERPSTADWTDQ